MLKVLRLTLHMFVHDAAWNKWPKTTLLRILDTDKEKKQMFRLKTKQKNSLFLTLYIHHCRCDEFFNFPCLHTAEFNNVSTTALLNTCLERAGQRKKIVNRTKKVFVKCSKFKCRRKYYELQMEKKKVEEEKNADEGN